MPVGSVEQGRGRRWNVARGEQNDRPHINRFNRHPAVSPRGDRSPCYDWLPPSWGPAIPSRCGTSHAPCTPRVLRRGLPSLAGGVPSANPGFSGGSRAVLVSVGGTLGIPGGPGAGDMALLLLSLRAARTPAALVRACLRPTPYPAGHLHRPAPAAFGPAQPAPPAAARHGRVPLRARWDWPP